MKEINKKINWKKLWTSISYAFFLLFLFFLELFTVAYFNIEFGQITAIAFGLLTFVLNLYFFVDIKTFRIKKKHLGIDTEINSILPFIIIGAPIAVNAFLLFIFYDPSMKETSGFIVGTDKDWLSFFGALLGGVITMIAVSYTIRNENEQRTIDLALRSTPSVFIEVDAEKLEYETRRQYDPLLIDEPESWSRMRFIFEITNKSSFIAKSISINSVLIDPNVDADNLNSNFRKSTYDAFEDKLRGNCGKIDSLFPNCSEVVSAPLSMKFRGLNSIQFTIVVKFYDQFEKNTHYITSIVNIYFNTSVDYKKSRTKRLSDLTTVDVKYRYSSTCPPLVAQTSSVEFDINS